jgi:hypothetical protein
MQLGGSSIELKDAAKQASTSSKKKLSVDAHANSKCVQLCIESSKFQELEAYKSSKNPFVATFRNGSVHDASHKQFLKKNS